MSKQTIIEREKEKLMSDVIGQTQVGVLEKIPNLKKRQRSIGGMDNDTTLTLRRIR
jgi:hypothetical protein